MRLKAPEMLLSGFDRPNISYSVKYILQGSNAIDEVVQLVIPPPGSEQSQIPCTIIYALKRDTVEEVAGRLRQQGMALKLKAQCAWSSIGMSIGH